MGKKPSGSVICVAMVSIFVCVLLTSYGVTSAAEKSKRGEKVKVTVDRVQTIFSDGRHNAFTSMCRWKGTYYVAFRSALTHPPVYHKDWQGSGHKVKGGHVKVVRSRDLKNWSASIAIDTEWDDKGPKLLATDDRLFAYAATVMPDMSRRMFMSFTEDGTNWQAPKEIYKPKYRFWKPKEHKGTYYVAAIDYEGERVVLLSSRDGIDWREVSTIIRWGKSQSYSETALLFLKDDSLVAVIRQCRIARAKPPYTEWNHYHSNIGTAGYYHYLGGPAAALVGDTVLVGGRGVKGHTVLYELDLESMKLKFLRAMPIYHLSKYTEGDKSYPGFAVMDNRRVLMSYYDGEMYEPGVPKQSDIRLARLTLEREPAAVEGAGVAPTGGKGEEIKIDLGQGVVLEMVRLEPGEFIMGSPLLEEQRHEDEPMHRVRITKPFYIAKYETTQALWMHVMKENPSCYKNMKNPVEQVVWDEVQKFLERLNKMVPGGGFRLPTEAEWEYACRAGTTTRYSFGDDEAALGRHAWHSDNSGGKTHEVGTREPNLWGLCDMYGNVWEWCQDWFDTYQFNAGGVVEDPVGAGSGKHRVCRGGSWLNYNNECRSAYRGFFSPDYRSSICGFRLARTVK